MSKCVKNLSNAQYSCIELYILIQIVHAYNKSNPKNPIKLNSQEETKNPDNYHKYLIDEMENRLSNVCKSGDHKCWLTQSFIKNLSSEIQEILNNYTFRPDGPKKQNEWLNNTHIYDVLVSYKTTYPNFIPYPPVPINFQNFDDYEINNIFNDMPKNAQIGLVINLDKRGNPGTHWVSFYTNTKTSQIYYFDSTGDKYGSEIEKFINKFKSYYTSIGLKPIVKYNTVQHQFGDSECGVYSLNFILRLLRGDKVDDIYQNPISDKEISSCRNVYFNNLKGTWSNICE